MSPESKHKLPLMVVDDEPDNLDLLYRTFRRDFTVYKANSGFEALKMLDLHGEMAVIISDQRMPRMNGTEFLGHTVEQFPDTIRIVLTGYTDVEDLVEAINSGKVFKYITKPWNPKELQDVVIQASETYRAVKHRTHALSQALRKESLVNEVLRGVRESLNYENTLQTVVDTLAKAFAADYAILTPCEAAAPASHRQSSSASQWCFANPALDLDPLRPLLKEYHYKQEAQTLLERPIFSDTLPSDDRTVAALTVTLVHQQKCLAAISLYRLQAPQWQADTIELIDSIAEQVALAIAQARLYQQVQDQSRQMRSELEVARQVQTNLLRMGWPQVEGVRVQARCRPAREVGGDFFEVFVQGDHIWLAVGDVAGKGVPAALFMASAIAVLRQELSHQPDSPLMLMGYLNTALSADLISSNCFITMVLARYAITTGELTYANAGHVLPMIWSSPQQQQPLYLENRGVPLGILPDWSAPVEAVQLSPGDTLLLTSDGLTEASLEGIEPGGKILKQEGLWRLIQQQSPPFELDWLLEAVETLSNQPQEDDQTALSLEVQR